MAEQFYTILTKIGKAKIANATALGTKVNLTKFQVGDGNGTYYNPTEDQTQLRNKVWEGNISSIAIDEQNPNWIVLDVIIPGDVGGFMIREAAALDDEGNLIAIGKYPETYKPVIADGSTKDLIIKMILEVSNTSSVTLKVDPTVILATQKDIQILNNKIENIKVPVTKVNEKIGDVVLTASDIKTASGETIESQLAEKAKIQDFKDRGLWDYCKQVSSGTDINTLKTNGKYMGSNLVNSPSGSLGWFIIEVTAHNNLYIHQKLIAFTAKETGSDRAPVYERICANGVWSAYTNLFQYANDGKTGIANAVTAKGVPASPTDTFATLASKIGQLMGTGSTITDANLRVDVSLGTEAWNNKDYINASDIAVDSLGNTYVSYSSGVAAVRKYNSSGVEVWNDPTVTGATAIAVDTLDNVYIVIPYKNSSDIGSIRKYNASGVLQWVKNDVNSPTSVTTDSSNNIYVGYSYSGGPMGLQKLDTNKNEIWHNSDYDSIGFMITDNLNNVYAGNSSAFRKYNLNGVVQWTKTDISNIRGIAIDSLGNMYVTRNDYTTKTVIKFNTANVEIWSTFVGKYGKDIKLDNLNNSFTVYSATDGSKNISKLTPNGIELWSDSTSQGGAAIALDKSFNIYVAYNVGSTTLKSVRKLYSNKYTII